MEDKATADYIRRQDHVYDDVSAGENPPGQHGHERADCRRRHYERRLLDRCQEVDTKVITSLYRSFGLPPVSTRMARFIRRSNRLDGSFLFTRGPCNACDQYESRT